MRAAERTTRAVVIGVGAAMAVALALRLTGLSFGLPAVYNPDEVAIMNRSMALAENGLNPRNFLYPSLYFYALFAWEGLWFAIGRAAGVFASLAAFERSFFADPTSIYLAGRLLSVCCGVATVWATFRLAARWFGTAAGLVAAFLLAVAPLAVRDAHYVKHDVPVTLLIVITHVLIADEWLTPAPARRWWRPALAAGLAMSTHYYAIFLAVPLAVAVLAPAAPDEPFAPRVRRLVLAAVVTTIAFAATSPFLVANPGLAIRDVIANRQIVVDRATTGGLFGSLGFYLDWLAHDGVGFGTALVAIPGLMLAMRAGLMRAALLLLFPLLLLLFIANTVPASRYLNAIVPFVAVLAGAAITATAWRQPLAIAALIAAMIIAGVASVREDLFFRETDTRTLALDWIEHAVPDGASVLIQPYSVPLRQSRAGLEEALTMHLGSPARASTRFQRALALTPYPSPAYRTIYLGSGGLDVDKIYVSPDALGGSAGLEPLRRLGVTYVVLKRFGDEGASLGPLTGALLAGARLEARFSPYRASAVRADATLPKPFVHNTDARITAALERPGPVIEIWRLR